MSILKTALDSIETLLTDNTSESALAQAADARIKIANAMSVEPVLYQRRMQADWHTGGNWTAWDDCSEATFKQVLIVPSLHGWTHEARALYLHPPQQATIKQCLKVGDSRFESWYSELNQAGKGSKQIAREAYDAGLNEADAQQAKQVPLTDVEIYTVISSTVENPEPLEELIGCAEWPELVDVIRRIEAHHGIGGQP